MQKEIWKDIPNYDGLYQVSSIGNVKSLIRKGRLKEKILKPSKDGGGYLMVMFRKNNKWERKMFYTDNIKVPFNKLIGCRITKHKWYYMDDEERAFCTKCYKRTGDIPREQWDRMDKLKQIKKRTIK